MVILKPTRKLLPLLPETLNDELRSDTALGDWYVNRFTVDRQPLLLLVSSLSLLPILTRARNVRSLPSRLAEVVAGRLTRLGVASDLIDAELEAMSPVRIARTSDRRVLGIMVDFAKSVPYDLEPSRWNDHALVDVEARLAETPCYASRTSDEVVFPREKAPQLLGARWQSG